MMRILILIAALAAFATAIPSNVQIQPISRNAIRITWRQDYSPNLKGFTIHYHNGDTYTTEWLTKTIWDPRASEAIVDGLRSEGEYSFCVRSIMTGRVCACSDLVHINIATGSVNTETHSEDDRRIQHGAQYGGQQQQQQQQQHQHGEQQDILFLETGAVGGDYVQLRWRYDGQKPAKYLITYRGYQRYETADDHWEEQEIDAGTPIESDTDQFVVQGLRPDTTYTFEVVVIDATSRRPISRPQTTRVTTKAYIL